MLTEKIEKAQLRLESPNGLKEDESLRGIMFRAGASDFEFSANQDNWIGQQNTYVCYEPDTKVGTLRIRKRTDGCFRLILTTPPISKKMTSEEFREMEQSVANGMDYLFNRFIGGRKE